MNTDLQSVLDSFEGDSDELIPILQAAQAALGYLPLDAMREVARFIGVPESRVYGVATFYAQFRFTPMGRNHVMVCRGTACHVRGAPKILEALSQQLGIGEGETTPDLAYTLETVACIGCCGLAPTIMVNKEVKAKLTPKKVRSMFRDYAESREEAARG